jgi:hypothetical protein
VTSDLSQRSVISFGPYLRLLASAAATNDATSGRRSREFQASTRRLGGASVTGTQARPAGTGSTSERGSTAIIRPSAIMWAIWTTSVTSGPVPSPAGIPLPRGSVSLSRSDIRTVINHTMIVSFDQPLSGTELDQYLADIEQAMLDTGLVQSAATRRHIPIPGEVIEHWQSRHPYRVAWANHEPLA